MTDYEVELGSLTEHRDLTTDSVDSVVVDVHVRRGQAPRGVADPQSGDYLVTFAVEDGHARFRSVEAESAFDDLALIAVRAAAAELQSTAEEYTVEAPLEAMADATYTTHDQP